MRQRLLLSALMITLLGPACDDDEPLNTDAKVDAPTDSAVPGDTAKADTVADTAKTDTVPNLDTGSDATDAKLDGGADATPDSADAADGGADAADASDAG
jgi:hypothetical protein